MTSTANNDRKDVHAGEANSNGINYLVLPISGYELPDADLAAVAGGQNVVAYQAWFTCLKSCAESKAQLQGELARFR